MENLNGSLGFKATLDIEDFKVSAQAMERHIQKASKSAVAETESLDKSIMAFAQNGAKYITSFLVGQGMYSLLQSIVQVRGQFQQLEIAFGTMLKSEAKATTLMNQLTETAAKTPFDLQGIAASAKQLMAYGSSAESVVDEIKMLGNVASGVGQPLGDIAYLYGTLRTQGRAYMMDIRQFAGRGIPIYEELAKVLNVSKDEVNALVTAGKVGFAEVEQVFKNLTQEGGMYFNLMERQSKSLTGQISNLEDAWDSMLNELGKNNQDLFSGAISSAAYMVEHYEEILRILKAVTIAYGSYRAALIFNTLATKGLTGVTLIDNTVRVARIALWKAEKAGILGVTAATKALWATMLSNPVGWVVGLLGALASVLYLFKSRSEETSEGQVSLANATKKAGEEFADQASKVDALQKVFRDSNQTYNERIKALKELKKLVPNYNAELTKEGKIIKDNADAIKTYLVQLEKQIRLKAAQDELEAAYKAKRLKEKEIEQKQQKADKANQSASYVVVGGEAGVQAQSIALQHAAQAERDVSTAKQELTGINQTIEELNKEINSTSASMASSTTTTKSYSEQVAEAEQNVAKLTQELAELRSGKVAKDNLAQAIEEKINELNAAKKTLSVLTGKRDGGDTSDKYSQMKLESERKLEEERIAVMDEGYTKRKEALDYQHKQNLAQIAKEERELAEARKNAGKGNLTADEKKVFETRRGYENQSYNSSLTELNNEMKGILSPVEQFKEEIDQTINGASSLAAKIEAIAAAKKKLAAGGFNLTQDQTLAAVNQLDTMDRDAQRELNQSVLNDFQSYEERKAEITANFAAMRLADVVKNNKELLSRINQGEQEALSALQAEQLQASADWKNLFQNLDTLTAGEIQDLVGRIEKEMASANLKLSPADFQALTDSLNRAKEKIVELNPFKALGSAFDSYIQATKKLKNAEKENLTAAQVNALKQEVKTAAQQMTESIQEITQLTGVVGDTVGSLAESFGADGRTSAVIAGVSGALGGVGKAAGGVGKIMSGDLMGGISDVISGIGDFILNLNGMSDAMREENIKDLQKEIDTLGKQYDNLGDAMQRAFSTNKASMMEEQNKLLEQQNEKIRKQIEEEEAKKNTDQERIAEWEEQIAENEKIITENTKYNIIDAINGTDIMSAIDDLSAAYADAWAAGETAAGKSANSVKNMIRTAIIEQLKNKLKPEVEKFMTYLATAMEDGVISEAEERMLEQMEEDMEEISDNYLSKNEKWMRDDKEEDSEDPLTGAVRSMSEETGGVIAGRMNAIVINQSDQTVIMRNQLIYQAEIAANTRASASELSEIKATLKRIENKDSSLLSQGIS